MQKNFFTEKENEILQLETRKKIFETIRSYPGIHRREIERKSALPAGTVTHHLHALKKYNLIREEQEGNNLRYFSKEFTQENQKLISVLRNESRRRILLFLVTQKKAHQQKIAAFLHRSPQTISWHLQKLLQKHMIQQQKQGKEIIYTLITPKEVLMEVLIRHKKSFLDTLVDRAIEMWEK